MAGHNPWNENLDGLLHCLWWPFKSAQWLL